MNDMGAFTGSREPSRVSPSRPVGFDPEREVMRVLDMAEAWDDAAQCLKRLDLDGFDKAMARFNTLRGEHD